MLAVQRVNRFWLKAQVKCPACFATGDHFQGNLVELINASEATTVVNGPPDSIKVLQQGTTIGKTVDCNVIGQLQVRSCIVYF